MGQIKNNDLFNLIQGNDEQDSGMIPIVTNIFNEDENDTIYPNEIPILPLRNTVLFPGVVIPLTIGRESSFKLIRSIQNGTKIFGAVSQKEAEIEEIGRAHV